MTNTPIHGCDGCNGTAGRMGCPEHGGREIKADEARYYEPKTTKLPVGMKIKCMCCGGGGIGDSGLTGGGGGGSLHCPHCPLSHSFIPSIPSAGKAGWEEVNKLTMDEAQRQKIPHHLQEHTIDFWKVELSGLIYDMVNHRPNKRIGYIPNYKDITVFISSELARERGKYKGSIFKKAGNIVIGTMSPEARDLLNRIMRKWEIHLKDLRKSQKGYMPTYYGFAYWLVRWSGLVAPTQAAKKVAK